ncbi:hypothetical protein ACIXN2_12120 [Bacteroides fragilis]
MVIAEGKETSDNLKYIIDTSNRKQLKIKNGESALTDKHFDSKGTETIGTTSYNIFESKPFMREYKGRHVDEKGHSVEIYENQMIVECMLMHWLRERTLGRVKCIRGSI